MHDRGIKSLFEVKSKVKASPQWKVDPVFKINTTFKSSQDLSVHSAMNKSQSRQFLHRRWFKRELTHTSDMPLYWSNRCLDQVFDQERDQEQKLGFKQDVGNRIIYGGQGPSNYRGRPAFLQDVVNRPKFPPGPGPNQFQKPGSLSSNLSKLNRGPLVQDLEHQVFIYFF